MKIRKSTQWQKTQLKSIEMWKVQIKEIDKEKC